MLTSLNITGFKSWAKTGDLKLAPITGLFGTNSSGKTTLLQSLLLLKQTAESSDRGIAFHFGDRKSLVDLGDFRSIAHQHMIEKGLSIALRWTERKPVVLKDSEAVSRIGIKGVNLGFSTKVHAEERRASKAQRMIVDSLEYSIEEAKFGLHRRQNDRDEYDLTAENSGITPVRRPGRAWPLPGPIKCYGFPDQVKAYYQNAGFLADLQLAFEEQLKRISYLGPLRAYPERRYTWSGSQPSDMGLAGDQAIHAILSSRERGEKVSPGKYQKKVSLEEYVATWLKQLGLIAEFNVQPLTESGQVYQVKVRKTLGGPEALITDVGFGVSQILPVIVMCFYAPEGSTIILEQPEIHLHPSVQSELADVLIDAHLKRDVQIIVESHSEHLLRRLQRRVADKSINRELVKLYFCESHGAESEIRELEVDVFGTITNWPRDFFGDQFGEIAETQKARLNRQKTEG